MVYHQALRNLKTLWLEKGCEVAQLANRNTEAMASLACNLMESGATRALLDKSQHVLARYKEFRSISIDATYKLALKVIGQT